MSPRIVGRGKGSPAGSGGGALRSGSVEGTFSLVPALPGWRALFADGDGVETGRSRVIAWASHQHEGSTRIVGIIADPNDPKSLVPADTVVDEDGGSLQRYGFVDS
jgi:hypothetical protein